MKNQINLDNIIYGFCSTDDLRPVMLHPITDGDFIVATNAHIIIVAPKKYFQKEYEPNHKFPNYKKVFADFEGKEILKIDAKKLLQICNDLPHENEIIECEECEGEGGFFNLNGKKIKQCDACNGQGEWESGRKFINFILPFNDRYVISDNIYFLDPNLIELLAKTAQLCNASVIEMHYNPDAPFKMKIFYFDKIKALIAPLKGETSSFEHLIQLPIYDPQA